MSEIFTQIAATCLMSGIIAAAIAAIFWIWK